MRRRTLWKRLLVGGLLIATGLLCAVIFFQFWIDLKAKEVGPSVRPALQTVLRAYFWSKITGAYWENEMLRQAKSVAQLPLQERLDFYRETLLNCDLDTSRALLFVEIVGGDAASLHQNLLAFKQGSRYLNLSSHQQKHVEDWLIETQIVSQTR